MWIDTSKLSFKKSFWCFWLTDPLIYSAGYDQCAMLKDVTIFAPLKSNIKHFKE